MGVYCQIHLDRPSEGVYRPGSVVSGAVKYAIDADTAYRDISVCLRGKGHCCWSEGAGYTTKVYYGYEDYVNVSNSLLDNRTGGEVLVQKGLYSYPFRFELPQQIPTSYNDTHCRIIFYVKLTFERKGVFNSKKIFRTEIPVVGSLDVTSGPIPIICGERKSLANIVTSGKSVINVKVTIRNPLVTPGDTAVLDVEVQNDTSTKISAIKTQLVEEITHISACGHKKQYFLPVKDTKTETEPVEEKSTASRIITLQIPEGLFSMYTQIVLKEYKFRVKIKLPFPHKSFVIGVPVVIREANVSTVAQVKAECSRQPDALLDVPPPPYWQVMQEDNDEKKKWM